MGLPSNTPTRPSLDQLQDANEKLSQAALLFERLLETIPPPEGRNELRDRLDTLAGLVEAHRETLSLPDATGGAVDVWERLTLPRAGVSPPTEAAVGTAANDLVAAIDATLPHVPGDVRTEATRDTRQKNLVLAVVVCGAAVVLLLLAYAMLRPATPEELLDDSVERFAGRQTAFRFAMTSFDGRFGRAIASNDELFSDYKAIARELERAPVLDPDLPDAIRARATTPEQATALLPEVESHIAALGDLEDRVARLQSGAEDVQRAIGAGAVSNPSEGAEERIKREAAAAEKARLAAARRERERQAAAERARVEREKREAEAERARIERERVLAGLSGEWSARKTLRWNYRGRPQLSLPTGRSGVGLGSGAQSGKFSIGSCGGTISLKTAEVSAGRAEIRYQLRLENGQKSCPRSSSLDFVQESTSKARLKWYDERGNSLVSFDVERQ